MAQTGEGQAMTTVLYVSGPISGLPEHNHPAFHDAALRLRDAGYAVLNPVENYGGERGLTRAEYMRVDIQLVLASQGVAVLPGWENSRGAKLEVEIAEQINLPVQTVDEWLREAESIIAFLRDARKAFQ